MFQFYSDEQYPKAIVDELRRWGYDVLTAYEDGRANQKIDDFFVLARAIQLRRTVLTEDRDDYRYLHLNNSNHAGIITSTHDPDRVAVATRIIATIQLYQSLDGVLIKIIKPNRKR